MATVEFDLKAGLKTSADGADIIRRHVVLGELSANDLLEAARESELVLDFNGEPVLVSSDALLGVHLLRRRIKKIDDLPGPIPLSLLGKLGEDDIELIQKKADELKKAMAIVKKVQNEGRSEGGSASD